jgi:hypothetical protein
MVRMTMVFRAATAAVEKEKNVKVKVTLEQVTKAQRGSRVIALLFP